MSITLWNTTYRGTLLLPRRCRRGVDWKAVIDYAMDTYNLEIWGGLGQTIGKIWRVGIMGYNATPGNVELVLAAFREALKAQGKLGNKDRPFLT